MTEPASVPPSEVVSRIAAKAGIEKAYVSAALNGLRDVVVEAVRNNESIDLGRQFGKFTTVLLKPRETFVPSSRKTVQVGARRKLRFKPSAIELKELED